MYISDEAVLKMERTRAKLEQKLRDRGVYVEDGEDIASLIEKIDKIGSNDYFKGLLEKTATVIDDDSIEVIYRYNFYNMSNLKILRLPNVKYIEPEYYNSQIYTISGNSELEEIDLRNLLELRNNYVLYNNRKVKKINIESLNLLSLATYAFQYLGSNVVEKFGIYAKSLSSMTDSSYAFANTGAYYVSLPTLRKVSNVQNLFTLSTNLKIVDIGFINLNNCYNMFLNCAKFDTLILRSNTVQTLSSTSYFTGTPFATDGTGGTVYCPQALIEDYKVATNWSGLNVTFVPLEGSIYEDPEWGNPDTYVFESEETE